jgi:GTPase SAR1 family protein
MIILGVDFQMKIIDVDGKSTALQLWDTCGQERFRAIAKSYFRRADGVVLMYDCTYERSFLNVREWILTVQDSTDKKLPVILVSNKTDLREKAREDGKKVVETDVGIKLAKVCPFLIKIRDRFFIIYFQKEHDALFIETSAKDGTNIHQSLVEIARLMRSNQDTEVGSSNIKLDLISEKKKSCCWSK